METFVPRRSTDIAEVSYDQASKEMRITFQSGGAYSYREVPWEVWLGIQNAPSAGQYFHRVIKNAYNYDPL